MGPQFIAVFGQDSRRYLETALDRPRARAIRAKLSVVIESNELIVLTGPAMKATTLDDGRSVILGTVFPKSSRTLQDIDTHREIISSAGEHLVSNHWGAYVAVLADAAKSSHHIVRDPSGGLPCYYISKGSVTIATSDLDLLTELGLFAPEIDWSYIVQHLYVEGLRPEETGLRGVTELLAGRRLTIGNELVTSEAWDPWRFADRVSQISDEAFAVEQVRDVTRACVRAWSSQFDHVLLSLSGGLDSSIVAAALAHSGNRFSCLNLVTRDPMGDERRYARMVAETLGVPLYEEVRTADRVNIEHSASSHLPRPVSKAFLQESDRLLMTTASRIGAQAFFNGGGGDNVFSFQRSAKPIADRLKSEGLGLGLIQTINDVVDLNECTYWEALRNASRHTWRRPLPYTWRTNPTLLNRDRLGGGQIYPHPWLSVPPHALPGKAAHIGLILVTQNFVEGLEREQHGPSLSPLLSQPLVELCLQIPSWMWCAGGRNRAVARKAFASDLPPGIINRQSKNAQNSFMMEVFEANRRLIREILNEGQLMKNGIIDKGQLEAALPLGAAQPTDVGRLMTLVGVETWAKSWTDRAVSRHPLEVAIG